MCTSTVYSHRASDPAFAAAWRTALACGVAVLGGRLIEERLAAMAEFDLHPAGLPPTPAEARERDLEFWRCLHLLREHGRGAGDGPMRRPRGGIRPRIKSNAEVRADVHRGLTAFEGRVRAANYRME